MGNSQTQQKNWIIKTPNKKFINDYQMKKPELSENEINQIYAAFQQYHPQNGKIKTSTLLKKFENFPDREKIVHMLGDKEDMSFNEFFNFTSDFIIEQKKNGEQIDINIEQQDGSCNFCMKYPQQNYA